MTDQQTISQATFRATFKRTNNSRNAIFGSRKALMEEIFATGIPIFCDESYYVHEQTLHRVNKVDDHFECYVYKNFEDWRDCHYYTLYEDAEGNKVWLMTGGRYD